MKNLLVILITVLAFQTNAQEIVGDWNGVLSFQGTDLRIVFHVTSQDGEFKSLMDSPDQGVTGIPTDKTTFEGGILKITSNQILMEYVAEIDENGILSGTFKQSGVSIPLKMTKK